MSVLELTLSLRTGQQSAALCQAGVWLAWDVVVGRLAGMSLDHELQKYYALLLGLTAHERSKP